MQRRSFLKFLGLAPAAAVIPKALEAEETPTVLQFNRGNDGRMYVLANGEIYVLELNENRWRKVNGS